MSNQYDDDENFSDGPAALREANEAKKQKLKEYEQRIADLESRLTATALNGVLTEFKKPERVKSALLADKVDPLDNEAVSKWLEDNGGDFAKGSADSTTQSQTSTDAAEAEAHARLQASGNLAQPASMSKLEAALADAGPNATGEELKAIYAKHGV